METKTAEDLAVQTRQHRTPKQQDIVYHVGRAWVRRRRTLKLWLKFLGRKYWDIEKNGFWLTNPIVIVLKILISAQKKYKKDDCKARAAFISYVTIVSLIPTLTVALSFYSVFSGLGSKKDQIFDLADSYLKKHNIRNIDIKPFTDVISQITDNAAGIGGIGLLFMVLSATAILRALDKTLNDIWHVKNKRSFMLRVTYYWAALSLGPLLLTTGGSLAGILANMFTLPTIHDVQSANSATDKDFHYWIAGDRGLLAKVNKNLSTIESLKKFSFDYENQKTYYLTDLTEKSKLLTELADSDPWRQKVTYNELMTMHYAAIIVSGNRLWAGAADGTLLASMDGGKHWQINSFGKEGIFGGYQKITINDIYFDKQKKGFIACDNNILLMTIDDGRSWRQGELILKRDASEDFSKNEQYKNIHLKKISFSDPQNGYILTNHGGIYHTQNGGESWLFQVIPQAKIQGKIHGLHDIAYSSNGQIWIVGQDGLILHSYDFGKTWVRKNKGAISFNIVRTLGDHKLIIAGDDGYVMFTNDNGELWDREKHEAIDFKAAIPALENNLLVLGSNKTVYQGIYESGQGINWQKITGGQSIWFGLVNFLVPFLFIWLLFVVTYITFPDTKVSFKAASIGASVTSAVWVIFILLLVSSITRMNNSKVAIYGSLALIPITFILINRSAVITLLGAEITYIIQNPDLYLKKKPKDDEKQPQIRIYDCIKIMTLIYDNFENNRGATKAQDLQKTLELDSAMFAKIITLLKDNRYINEKQGLIEIENNQQYYLPCKSSSAVNMDDFIALIIDGSFEIAQYNEKDSFMSFIDENFADLKNYRQQKMQPITLEDLLRNYTKRV